MNTDYGKLADILKGVEDMPVEPEEDINKKIVETNEEKVSSNIQYQEEGDSSDIFIDFGFDGDDNEDDDNGDGEEFITISKEDMIEEDETDIISFGEEGKDRKVETSVAGVLFEEEEVEEEEFGRLEDKLAEDAMREELVVSNLSKQEDTEGDGNSQNEKTKEDIALKMSEIETIIAPRIKVMRVP